LIEGREPSRLFTFISEPSELNPFEELRELLTREPPPRKLIAVEEAPIEVPVTYIFC
jgi:hypothetical protein